MGDQSGAIHIWDLKTDHNEQLVSRPSIYWLRSEILALVDHLVFKIWAS